MKDDKKLRDYRSKKFFYGGPHIVEHYFSAKKKKEEEDRHRHGQASGSMPNGFSRRDHVMVVTKQGCQCIPCERERIKVKKCQVSLQKISTNIFSAI